MSEKKSRSETVLPPHRKHSGGPITLIKADPLYKPRPKRGLALSSPPPTRSRVRVIMRDGVILEPRRFNQIAAKDSLRKQPAESLVTAASTPDQAVVPAKTNPGASPAANTDRGQR